jgi:hypothetical protein
VSSLCHQKVLFFQKKGEISFQCLSISSIVTEKNGVYKGLCSHLVNFLQWCILELIHLFTDFARRERWRRWWFMGKLGKSAERQGLTNFPNPNKTCPLVTLGVLNMQLAEANKFLNAMSNQHTRTKGLSILDGNQQHI